jgi:hypothetical protein
MTPREHIRAVFNSKKNDCPPASIRLDLWHKEMSLKDSLPEEAKGMSLGELEDSLGFCRTARYRSNPRIFFKNSTVESLEKAGEKVDKYIFAEGLALSRVTAYDNVNKSLAGHIIKYPLETEEDYDLILSRMQDAYVDIEFEDFEDFDAATGDAGLPVFIIGPCPAHHLMLEFCGYENFFLHMFDFPEKVDSLINHFERIYRRDIWPVVCGLNAELILHGAHFSSQMTPPPIFEKYFLPYFKEFNELMHSHNKKVIWHADAEMGNLLDLVIEAGFDGTDCLICEPLVKQKMEEYFDVWQGNIVCWGGLPSVIFEHSYPLEKYMSHVDQLINVTKDRKDFIFGASDNVMPGADWNRVRILAEKLRFMEA